MGAGGTFDVVFGVSHLKTDDATSTGRFVVRFHHDWAPRGFDRVRQLVCPRPLVTLPYHMVATISRLPECIGLFCNRALPKEGLFGGKEADVYRAYSKKRMSKKPLHTCHRLCRHRALVDDYCITPEASH